MSTACSSKDQQQSLATFLSPSQAASPNRPASFRGAFLPEAYNHVTSGDRLAAKIPSATGGLLSLLPYLTSTFPHSPWSISHRLSRAEKKASLGLILVSLPC